MLFIGNFSDTNSKEFKVVDGQQRLTTITILFSVISRLFYENGETDIANSLFDYIMTKDDDGAPVRIIKTETSHPYFADCIQRLSDRKDVKTETEEEDNIKEVYEYFYYNLSEQGIRKLFKKCLTESTNKIPYIDLLKAIREQVMNCLTVCITTLDKQDAYKLFEILNGKGKALSDADLIKNRLFEHLSEEEPSDFANENWKKIGKNLTFEDGFVETIVFLRHFWMSTRSNVTKSNLYSKFINNIHTNEYKDFLLELVENSCFYNLTLEPSIGYFCNRKEYCEAVQSLKWLNEFGVIQSRIAIMALLDTKNKGFIKQRDFTNVLTFLQDFHFTYNTLMKQRANRLNNIYSKFSIKLRICDSNKSVVDTLKDYLYKPLIKLLPKYDEFEDEFIKLSYSSKYEYSINMKAKFVLNRLNTLFSKNNLFENNGSVEHIIPQADGEFTYNIGNLILLEQPLNAEADSFDYAGKKNVYGKSNYNWIKMFVSQFNTFDQSLIEPRSKELSKLYYKNFVEKYTDSL